MIWTPRPIERATSVLTLPPLTGGLNTRDPPPSLGSLFALEMDNWISRGGTLETRKGYTVWATGMNGPVHSLLTYSPPSTGAQRAFAVADGAMYDISASGAVGSPVMTGLGTSPWSAANFTNSAGSFLIAVSPGTAMRRYDGASWTSVPTLGPLSTDTLAAVVVYQGRLFFLQESSLSFWFLPAGAISGTAQEFRVGQVLPQGGRLVAAGVWTLDAGRGLDDHLVLVSSRGEVVVYQGIDPTSATDWKLVGVYTVAKPIGPRSVAKFGGDLVLLTDRGLFLLSRALQSATVERTAAVTDAIAPSISTYARFYSGVFGWEPVLVPQENLLLINVPAPQSEQFVFELTSRAWSRFTGWDVVSFASFGPRTLAGTKDGRVLQLFDGATDAEDLVKARFLSGTQYVRSVSGLCALKRVRPYFRAGADLQYFLLVQSRAVSKVHTCGPFGGFAGGSSAVWDQSYWDQAYWAGTSATAQWHTVYSVPSHGYGLGAEVSAGSLVAFSGFDVSVVQGHGV